MRRRLSPSRALAFPGLEPRRSVLGSYHVAVVRFRAAVAQVRAASSTPDAVERVASVAREARAENAELVVFSEALLGGYPPGANFGAVVGDGVGPR